MVGTPEHPDKAVVDVDDATAARIDPATTVASATYDAEGRVDTLLVVPGVLPKAPPVWFSEVPEPSATPAATNLVMFVGHGQPDGAFLVGDAFTATGATSADQVGAFRWYPETGLGHQLYVAEAWRRRGLGNVVLICASLLALSRGWPQPYGGGERTELGEKARRGMPHAMAHAQELTALLPPMTPADEAVAREALD